MMMLQMFRAIAVRITDETYGTVGHMACDNVWSLDKTAPIRAWMCNYILHFYIDIITYSPWARSMKLVHRYHFRWQIPPYIFWMVRLSTFWKSLGAMSKK